MDVITGRTQIFGILADPIAQVKTPEALNGLMHERGFDGVLVPFHVAAKDLAVLLDGLRRIKNFGGAIVTVPHKVDIVNLCDRVETQAALIGAVNCIKRQPDGSVVGTNVDGAGFVAGLRAHGIDPRGATVYLAGAGGAAAAIAFAMAEAGAEQLTIFNRTATKAAQLAERVESAFPRVKTEASVNPVPLQDIVINGTSLGMRPSDPLPIDPTHLKPHQCVADIIMDPVETALLKAARERGCRVQFGRPMLDGQIELMAEFLGMRP